MSGAIKTLQSAAARLGIDVRRHRPTPPDPLAAVLMQRGVEVFFDIGANVGQSGQYVRSHGYAGRVVSCEPVSHLFEQLARNAAHDSNWTVLPVAVGEQGGSTVIHVSGGHGGASSALTMNQPLAQAAPDMAVVRDETVAVTTLAQLMAKHYPVDTRAFVKIDVQGAERSVLHGAGAAMDRVVGLLIEMSISPSYDDEPLIQEMLPTVTSLGFRLHQLIPGWRDPRSGELLQVDGLFVRPDASSSSATNCA